MTVRKCCVFILTQIDQRSAVSEICKIGRNKLTIP